MVINGQLTDLTPSFCVPHNYLGVAVHRACPSVCQHHLLVFAKHDFVYRVVDLFFQHLRFLLVSLLKNNNILHAVYNASVFTVPTDVVANFGC